MSLVQIGELRPEGLESVSKKGAVEEVARSVGGTKRRHVLAIIVTQRMQQLQARRVLGQEALERQRRHRLRLRVQLQEVVDYLGGEEWSKMRKKREDEKMRS